MGGEIELDELGALVDQALRSEVSNPAAWLTRTIPRRIEQLKLEARKPIEVAQPALATPLQPKLPPFQARCAALGYDTTKLGHLGYGTWGVIGRRGATSQRRAAPPGPRLNRPAPGSRLAPRCYALGRRGMSEPQEHVVKATELLISMAHGAQAEQVREGFSPATPCCDFAPCQGGRRAARLGTRAAPSGEEAVSARLPDPDDRPLSEIQRHRHGLARRGRALAQAVRAPASSPAGTARTSGWIVTRLVSLARSSGRGQAGSKAIGNL